MRRWIKAAVAAAAIGLLLPLPAMAALELDLGFEPAEVCPGEWVQFFFALANVGDEAEMVDLAIMLSFGGQEFGPFGGTLALAAGEEITRELRFRIPPPAPAGTLTVSATATDSDGTVEDSATLEILDCMGPGGGTSPQGLIESFRRALRGIGIQ